MRLTAYHDSNGNIVGLAASPSDDSIPAEVRTDRHPGLRAMEIEAPSALTLDPADPVQLHAQLSDLVQNYRIDGGALLRRS